MIEKTYKIYYSANEITPTGTKEITENGSYDISSYANAKVNVMPIEITENADGTVDLTILENTSVAVAENDGTVDITIPTE